MRAFLSSIALAVCLLASSSGVKADEASHRQAVLEYFKLANMEGLMNESMDAMLKAQLQMNPALAQVQDTFRTFFSKYMSWAALEPEFTTIYMKSFSEAEMKQLLTFYKTPVGKKALLEMPKLMQQGAQVGAQHVQQHMPELMQALQEKEKEGKLGPKGTGPQTKPATTSPGIK